MRGDGERAGDGGANGIGSGSLGRSKEPAILLAVASALLLASAYRPHDLFTWFLEVAPILVGAPVLVASRRRFPLTPLAYRLIVIHALILMVGGHYTYAEVPVGFWMKETFHFARNHYDRIGHLAQGFIPAILAREILLRRSPLVPGKWLLFLVTSVCLAFSATYELFEWGTAVATGEAATAFLGTQGDPWDTQADMLCALVGAIASQTMLGRRHDRELGELDLSSSVKARTS